MFSFYSIHQSPMMTNLIKTVHTLGLAVLSVSAALAQNRIEISQSGSRGTQATVVQQKSQQSVVTIHQSADGVGNQAIISQSGQGNQAHINQSGSITGDSSGQSGNRVNLRVDSTTQTTISQQGTGPHRVELVQDGRTTTIVYQSSGMDDSTVTTRPGQDNVTPRPRSSKRRNRR